ncbi:hypothetical protein L1049_022543 [Liquidambar formosana]|uniref:DUF7356 domain-containing protein n=1 Tax=Liquidambar formosana TaxID=63359 RepID=A0AAP0REG2_LIQFO
MQRKQVGLSERMETCSVLLLGCFLVLLAVDCSSADSKVKTNSNTGLDLKTPIISSDKNNTNAKTGGLDPVLDPIKTNGDQVDRSNKDVQNDSNNSNSSEQGGSKEVHNVKTDKGGANGQVQEKEDRTGKSGKGLESNDKSKGNNDQGTLVKPMPLKKENTEGEGCDASNSCIDAENKLVACLRVPGDESPDLSLLIQNKGKGPLTVTISAPDHVHIEETKIQLKEKDNKELIVTIRNGGTDNVIVLMAGNGRCNLDFKNLIAHNSGKDADAAPKFKYIIFLSRTPSIAFVFLAGLLIIASAWMCVSFWKRHFSSNSSKYQKLETELPVSCGGKIETDINDGWDDSWDDNWDDEEAPRTPSMPVTPSLSSKGLSSRRFNKEGWKD